MLKTKKWFVVVGGVILFIALLVLILALSKPEAFAAPSLNDAKLRDCVVYFTNDKDQCDADAYKYSSEFHQSKLDALNEAIKLKGGTPTPEQNKEFLRLKSLLEDYARIPGGRFCKLTIPEWKELIRQDAPETPVLGKTAWNADRGSTNEWAFCWRADAKNDSLKKTGMVLSQNSDGTYEGAKINGKFYVRGTFDEGITPENVAKTYCEETKNVVSAKPKNAIVFKDAVEDLKFQKTVVQGISGKPVLYVNGVEKTPTYDDVYRLFDGSMYKQEVTVQGNEETVVAKPREKSYRVVKYLTDPCNRRKEDYGTNGLLSFTQPIELARTRLADTVLRGDIPTVEKRLRGIEPSIAELHRQRQAHIDRIWWNYGRINHWQREIGTLYYRRYLTYVRRWQSRC